MCFVYFTICLVFLNFLYIFERKKNSSCTGLGWSLLLFLIYFWLFAVRDMLGSYVLVSFW